MIHWQQGRTLVAFRQVDDFSSIENDFNPSGQLQDVQQSESGKALAAE